VAATEMAQAARVVTVERGVDPRELALVQPDVRVFERTSDLLRFLRQLKAAPAADDGRDSAEAAAENPR